MMILTVRLQNKEVLRNNNVILKLKFFLIILFLDELMLTEVTSIDKAGFQKDTFRRVLL